MAFETMPSKRSAALEDVVILEAKDIISVLAVVISLVSFYRAYRSDERAKKAESVRELLGKKENVAFGALKLLREGLPAEEQERQLVVSAVMQACVFGGSDRARALLFRVIEQNRANRGSEFKDALARIKETFASMEKYKFSTDELDLGRGHSRIEAVAKVVSAPS